MGLSIDRYNINTIHTQGVVSPETISLQEQEGHAISQAQMNLLSSMLNDQFVYVQQGHPVLDQLDGLGFNPDNRAISEGRPGWHKVHTGIFNHCISKIRITEKN